MSKVGRKPLEVPRIRWQVFVNQKLAAAVELLLMDPVTQKARYGARTEYIEGLIRKDLESKRIKVDESDGENTEVRQSLESAHPEGGTSEGSVDQGGTGGGTV